MRVHVRKWGNSASVRLPVKVLAAARIEIDQAVEVREEEGRIIIERWSNAESDLEALVARMDPATFPEEVDFGPPAGGEVW